MPAKSKSAHFLPTAAAIACCAVIVLLAAASRGADPPSGGLVFSKSTIDFGKVPQGKKKIATFKFVNKSENPAEIKKVRTDCLCAVAAYPKEGVPAGGEGEIKVELRTAGHKGTLRSKIAIKYASGGKDYYVPLTMQANVHQEGKLVADPKVIELGQITAETEIVKKVSVKNAGKEVRSAIRSVDAPPWIHVATGGKPDGDAWVLTVKGPIPNRPGELSEKIVVHTDSKVFPTLIVPIEGRIERVVTSIPHKAWTEVDLKGGNRSIVVRIVDRKGRKITSTELVYTKRFREGLSSVEIKDGKTPSEKVLVAAIPDGKPEKGAVSFNTSVTVKVEGREYVVPINLMFIRRRTHHK